jgi:hypothetical protein
MKEIQAAAMTTPRWAWTARAWIRGGGRAGVIGAALLAIAAIFTVSGVASRRAEVEALQQDLLARRGGDSRGLAHPAAGRQDSLRAFYASFPPVSDTPARLERLHALAAAAGVTLESGEYALEADQGARLVRYRMVLPAKGTYPQLRDFIGRVLADTPTLSLEDITLKRPAVSAQRLEARLKMTLFVREQP